MLANFPFENIFVGRHRELKMLDKCLQATMRGEKHLIFIAGDAGAGKTTLIREFCHRAEQKDDGLVVVFGSCSALATDIATESYQPFKDIFRMLTSSPDEQLSGPTVTAESRKRIHNIFGQVINTLAELGPDLIGLFVPFAGLLAKVGTYAASRKGWIEGVTTQPEPIKAELSQDLIFEQFSRVVLQLASKVPIILILDDLQWADRASLNLLFYLTRRVSAEKLLIVCAYRPTDIQQSQQKEMHPLVRALNELQRQFGDITVELKGSNNLEARLFLDALLDSEPNTFDEDLRAWLFQRTGGHPLFTVEILRSLHERGLLVQDDQSRWMVTGKADLESLPTRVEAVIGERISRLSEELRSILTHGSVMGDAFTAEVIGRMEKVEQRDLLQKLSQDLERHHRLVQESGTQTVNNERLHFFKFVHVLFRQFVYGQLGSAEREMLHLAVGQTLEILYGKEAISIAPQLAQHFHLGYNLEKATHYYEEAGNNAKQQYAYSDAVMFYTQALTLIPIDAQMRRFNLLEVREIVNEQRGERQAQYDDLEEMTLLAQGLTGKTSDSKGAYVHNRKCILNIRERKHNEARQEAEIARSLASEDSDKSAEAFALFNLGRAYYFKQQYHESIIFSLKGLELYRELNIHSGEANCLHWLGVTSWYVNENNSILYIEEALKIQKELGQNWEASYSLRSLGNYYLTRDLRKAEQCLKECLKFRESIGDQRGKEGPLGDREEHGLVGLRADLALLYTFLGQYDKAGEYCKLSMDRTIASWAPGIMAIVYTEQDNRREALALLEKESAYFSRNPSYLARYRHETSRIQLLIYDLIDARENIESALKIRSEIEQTGNRLASLALLAHVLRASEEPEKALESALQAVECLEAGTGTGLYRKQEVWYDCYKAMVGISDEQVVRHALQQAHELVVDQSARLNDQKLRDSFLNNVRLNREIEADWYAWNNKNGG